MLLKLPSFTGLPKPTIKGSNFPTSAYPQPDLDWIFTRIHVYSLYRARRVGHDYSDIENFMKRILVVEKSY